jgi:hypothetical protein
MSRLMFLSGLSVLVLFASVSLAVIPKLINYQGMLTNSSGDPLTGTYDINFRVYNASSGGDQRWEETQTDVAVTGGLFNVILGGATVGGMDLDFSEEYWLEIWVEGEQMSERLRFTSVGYAYRAQVADSAVVAGTSAGGTGGWVDDGTAVRLQTSTDMVGIGTTDPGEELEIQSSYPYVKLSGHSTSDDYQMGVNNYGLVIYNSDDSLYEMVINNDGNVGIGTTSLDDDLHVANHIRVGEDPTYSTVYGELKHDGGGTGFKINANAGGGGWADMLLQTNGATRIFIESGGNVGIGTTMPNSKLDINGSMAKALKEIYHSNSPYSLTDGDCILAGNAISGQINVILPLASSVYRRVYTVKKVDGTSNWVYILPQSGDKIDGFLDLALTTQWMFVTVISNGSDWLIIGKSW